MNFENCFTVDTSGLQGGLALIWNQGLDLSIQSYSTWHNSAKLSMPDNQCKLTMFYGHPKTSKREGSSNLLKMLKPDINIA